MIYKKIDYQHAEPHTWIPQTLCQVQIEMLYFMGVARHGFTCRGQSQGWEESRQRSFLCSLIYLACLAGSSIPITIVVVCHPEGSSYPGESSKVSKASRKCPLLLVLISRTTSMSLSKGTGQRLLTCLKGNSGLQSPWYVMGSPCPSLHLTLCAFLKASSSYPHRPWLHVHSHQQVKIPGVATARPSQHNSELGRESILHTCTGGWFCFEGLAVN